MENFKATPVPQEFQDAILATIETALDFTVDILSTSDLPMQRFSSQDQVLELERVSQLSEEIYGISDETTESKYVLSIWNDQRHSFEDVINMIMLHLKKKMEFGEMIASNVDSYGRGILTISSNLEELLRLKVLMQQTGLIHTIRSTKDYFREEMSDCIIHWLLDITTSSINNNFLILGTLVSQALCNTWRVGVSSSLRVPGIQPPDESLIAKVSSSLVGPSIPQVGSFPIQPYDLDQPIVPNDMTSQLPPYYWLNDGPEPPNYTKNGVSTRVQYLIYFDVRLWRSLRSTLRDLYIAALVSNADYKPIFGHCYAQVYCTVAELSILVDREPEHSIVSNLSTQLFTTPTIATSICNHNYISKYLAGLFNFFTKFRIGVPACVNESLKENTVALKNRRYSQLFIDMGFLLQRNTDKARVTGAISRTKQISAFLKLFQGVAPMQRQKGAHVEYESDGWIRYFNCMLSVLQLANSFAAGIVYCNDEQTESVIKEVCHSIYKWAFDNELYLSAQSSPFLYNQACVGPTHSLSFRSSKIKVEDDEISLHHPIHVYLSLLLQYGQIQDRETLQRLVTPPDEFCDVILKEDATFLLFDYNIRVLVLLSQIKVGLWVRNGFSVRNQMNYYRDTTLREPAFSRDIFMVQTALAVLDPKYSLARILQRWGFLDWFNNGTFKSIKSIYMMEDFIHYLIVFLTERRNIMGLSEKETKRKYIVREIIQSLGFKPLSFSELCENIPDSLTSDEMFEIALSELSSYKPPVGLRGSGLYELKAEYMHLFDPHYLHFSSAKMEEAHNILKNFIHKSTNQPLKEVYIEPVLEPITSGPYATIGAFTRSHAFAYFVFQLLTFVKNDTENEREGDTILGLVLKLCHVAALDDLNMNTSHDQTFAYYMCQSIDIKIPITSSIQILPLYRCTDMSVLVLLYQFSCNPTFNSYKAQINRILELIHSKYPDYVQKQVNEKIGDVQLTKPTQIEIESKETKKKNEKKKLAKKKQKRILENMQKQQKKFAEQNKSRIQDEDIEAEVEENEDWKFPRAECILCRMPCDSKRMYGVLAYVNDYKTDRYVPFDTPEWVYEAFGFTQNLDEEEPEIEPIVGSDAWKEYKRSLKEKNKIGPGFPKRNIASRIIVSSCCHTLHYACYDTYRNTLVTRPHQLTRNHPDDSTKGECLCPLCRSLNNTFIPIFWKSNSRSIVDILKTDETTETFGEFLNITMNDSIFGECFNFPGFVNNLGTSVNDSINPQYGTLLGFDQSEFPIHAADQKHLAGLELVLTVVAHNMTDYLNITFDKSSEFDLNSVRFTLASTISDLELSLRGVGYKDTKGGLVVDQIPTLSLSTLRIFVEYARTLIGYCYGDRFDSSERRMWNLFKPSNTSPLVTGCGPFPAFIQAALLYSPGYQLHLNHFLKVYFIAEIIRVIMVFVNHIVLKALWIHDPLFFELPVFSTIDPSAINALSTVVGSIRDILNISSISDPIWSHPNLGAVLYSVVLKSVTPFLRRCAIFMYSFCAKDYETRSYQETGSTPEANRLCDFLMIPHFDVILLELSGGTPNNAYPAIPNPIPSAQLINFWVKTYSQDVTMINLEYPGIVKLINLPNRLDELFSLPLLRKEVDDSLFTDPAICLFCSQVVQVQQISQITTTGQCNAHMADGCCCNIGIFLLPKRSSILLLNNEQGSFMPAPYLDLHGESEDTRYDKL